MLSDCDFEYTNYDFRQSDYVSQTMMIHSSVDRWELNHTKL
jgi:hypothetical protein